MRQRVLILGYGEMGHAMEFLLAERHELSIWNLGSMVRGGRPSLAEAAAEARLVLFCLPVNAHFEVASLVAPLLPPDSVCLTIAKGLDESGRTAAQVFDTVFRDTHRYGVIYGPMISEELRAGLPGFADVVLSHPEDGELIEDLFRGSTLVCQQASDLHGRSWSVILKNVYAILFGVADELGLGRNMRGHLMVAAVAELSGIVQSFGGHAHTPYSYAGLGDLMTTGTSEDSHHHTLGRKLVRGEWDDISGEGVHTLKMVEKFGVFDWRARPLFTLARDVVIEPQKLEQRVEDYLGLLRSTRSCPI